MEAAEKAWAHAAELLKDESRHLVVLDEKGVKKGVRVPALVNPVF
jgi:ATP:corrinoid adenosyltransferase